MATRNFVPRADNEGQIGTAAKKWAKVITAELTLGTQVVSQAGKDLFDDADVVAQRATLGVNKALFVNVMDYGANGGGTVDDTAAIQAAVNAVSVSGGTVFLPAGTYKISSAITINNSHVRLMGGGKGNTTINQITASVSAITAPSTLVKIGVSDMTVSGNGGTGNSGLYLSGVSNSEFINLLIDGFEYGVKYTQCGNITFDSVYSSNCDYGFFVPYEGDGSNFWSWTVRFVNCYATLCTDGWRINNTADLFFDTCIAVTNTGKGFNIGADNVGATLVDTVMFKNCQSDSNKDFGYFIYQYRFVQLNNVWVSSGRDASFQHAGIFMWLCNYINLSGILALNNGAEGIKLLGCKYLEANSITATGNRTIGVYIEAITQGNLVNINTSQITEVGMYTQAQGFVTAGANSNVVVSDLLSINNGSNQIVNGGTGVIIKTTAPVDSPTFTGVPSAPTAAVDTNTTQLATTAMVLAQSASATPLIDAAVAVVGVSKRFARGDHVHPTDTGRAASVHTHLLAAGATDVTASAAELNQLDGKTITAAGAALIDDADAAAQRVTLGGIVVGPASFTDHAIVRADGVTGKLLQNSLAGIDDAGKLICIGLSAGYNPAAPDIAQALTYVYLPRACDITNFIMFDQFDDAAYWDKFYNSLTFTPTPSPGVGTDIFRDNTNSIQWASASSPFPIVIEVVSTTTPITSKGNGYYQIGLTFRDNSANKVTHIKIEIWDIAGGVYATVYDANVSMTDGWVSPRLLAPVGSGYNIPKLKVTMSGNNPLSSIFYLQRLIVYHASAPFDPWHLPIGGGRLYGNLLVDGSLTVGATLFSAAGLALMDDAAASNQRTTLGLGTMAVAAAADYVEKALFDAYTILMATTDNTPVALTVTEQTLLGRITGGAIAALSIAQIRTLLSITAAGAELINDTTAAAQRATLGIDYFTKVDTITAGTTTLDATHYIVLANAATGGITVNLPTAVGISGRKYYVMRIDSVTANAVAVVPNGAELINGSNDAIYFTAQWMVRGYISNGTSWFVINY